MTHPQTPRSVLLAAADLKPTLFLAADGEEMSHSIEDAVVAHLDHGGVSDPIWVKVHRWVELPPVWIAAHWPRDGELTITEHATEADADAGVALLRKAADLAGGE